MLLYESGAIKCWRREVRRYRGVKISAAYRDILVKIKQTSLVEQLVALPRYAELLTELVVIIQAITGRHNTKRISAQVCGFAKIKGHQAAVNIRAAKAVDGVVASDRGEC